MYEVREGEYVYKLNVCGHVTGSKCNGNEHDNAAVCQEKSSEYGRRFSRKIGSLFGSQFLPEFSNPVRGN